VTLVTVRVSECTGCAHDHGLSRVRHCSRCGEPCWISADGQRLVAAVGAVVECTHCSRTPGLIVLVKQENFWPAVEEARRHREHRRAEIGKN